MSVKITRVAPSFSWSRHQPRAVVGRRRHPEERVAAVLSGRRPAPDRHVAARRATGPDGRRLQAAPLRRARHQRCDTAFI